MQTKTLNPNWYQLQLNPFTEARYPLMAMMMIFPCCFASIAGTIALTNGGSMLFELSVTITMASNISLIAIAPAKWCVGLFYLSVIGNALIIALTFILFDVNIIL